MQLYPIPILAPQFYGTYRIHEVQLGCVERHMKFNEN